MATNLGSSTLTYTTTNIKPEANEQIDALWGQNMADNTAAGRHGLNSKHYQGTAIIGGMRFFEKSGNTLAAANLTSSDEQFFLKDPTANNLRGTYTFTGTSTASGNTNGTMLVRIDTGTVAQITYSTAGGSAISTAGAVNFDISGYTAGDMKRVFFTFDDNTTQATEDRRVNFYFNLWTTYA